MTDESSHALGIMGELQHVAADLNQPKASVVVHHVLDEDGTASTTISQEQVRKALGVSHINLHNVTGMEIHTQSSSAGPIGCTVRSGNGAPFPITDRQTAMVGGAMAAAHQIVLPNATEQTEVMPLKAITTDKNKHVPHHKLTEEEKMRNKLNASYYAGEEKPPSDERLYLHTVKASNGGDERVAIPLKSVVTPEDGGLTAVASRCIIHQKKSPKTLAADATIIQMPHRTTGEMCDHLMASTRSVEAMADAVRKNTTVNKLFGDGVVISTHPINEHCQPGDHVTHKIVFHREPSGDAKEVSYKRDFMPESVAGGIATVTTTGGLEHEGAWHSAMFGKKGSAGASTDHTHGADAQATNAAPAVDQVDEGN